MATKKARQRKRRAAAAGYSDAASGITERIRYAIKESEDFYQSGDPKASGALKVALRPANPTLWPEFLKECADGGFLNGQRPIAEEHGEGYIRVPGHNGVTLKASFPLIEWIHRFKRTHMNAP